MKIFQIIRKNFNALGFSVDDCTINKNNIWAILISSSAIASQFVYTWYEVDSIEEYVQCIFMITGGLGISISFLSIILKKTELSDLIDELNETISKSK